MTVKICGSGVPMKDINKVIKKLIKRADKQKAKAQNK
jgi:hypothetical protein